MLEEIKEIYKRCNFYSNFKGNNYNICEKCGKNNNFFCENCFTSLCDSCSKDCEEKHQNKLIKLKDKIEFYKSEIEKIIKNYRGRKATSNKLLGKKHKKTDNDNIQTKIQVHFINFLINMVNDAVKTEFDSKFLSNIMKNNGNIDVNSKKKSVENLFRYINHKEKKKINYDYLINILQNPIKNIITTNVSSKYRKFKNDFNKMLYLKLKEKSEWFSAFLNQKFIDVFINYYYNEEKPLQMINFEGKTINFSKKTETFAHLLIKNKNLKNQMIDLVKNNYLNEYNKSKKFITSKNAL